MVRKVMAMMLALALALGCVSALAETAEGEWWNILLLGSDDRDMSQRAGRTDTIMILSVNQAEGRAKLTSIMRDTWVGISGKGNNKINAANVFGGPELAVQTVNENFGTDIEDYVLINMQDLSMIIDLFGGVDLELSASEVKHTNDYIAGYIDQSYNHTPYPDETRVSGSGMMHLNGLQAMSFCRDRYTDSDFGRVMRQQKVLLAMAEKAQNMEVSEVLDIAGQMQEKVSTNLTSEEAAALATAVLSVDIAAIGQYRIPADGAYKSGTFDGTWMIKADLEENAEILRQYIYVD